MCPSRTSAYYLEAMDSHGGWIRSSIDLVRFASALDNPDKCPVLGRQGIEMMFSRPPAPVGLDAEGKPKNSFYACGWAVDLPDGDNAGQQHHNGLLDGNAGVIRRRTDGICWVTLFNCARAARKKSPNGTIVTLMNEAITQIKECANRII